MANAAADNAKYVGDILVWLNLATGDTPIVWKYTCPVGPHKLASPVQLTSTDARCPVHATASALTGETAVSMRP